ncbi:hypothetical protein [uncultured Massilia sp.]|uniref:hypothetical protein n=1 Tax=uncultured Massilia sp. TaxID=169973 RepID=UPI0025D1DE64|nr:hypothetical protein [uncultured Massilia sp.]
MNATFDIFHGGAPGPRRRQLARIGAGIALSLVLHAVLLAVHRQPAAPVLPAPAAPLTVRLRPPPAPPVPAVRAPVPAGPAPAPRPAPRRQAAPRPSTAVIAVDPSIRRSSGDTYTVEPAPALPAQPEPPPAPGFDLDAALKTARKVANAPDPARVGTALERLPKPPLQTESKFERAIKSARRRDCREGVQGGLLAPIFLAMDKKDSGCKW